MDQNAKGCTGSFARSITLHRSLRLYTRSACYGRFPLGRCDVRTVGRMSAGRALRILRRLKNRDVLRKKRHFSAKLLMLLARTHGAGYRHKGGHFGQRGISSFGCMIVWLYFHVNKKEPVWRLIKTYFLSFTIRTGGGEKGGASPICWTCWQEATVPAITATAATFANEGYIFSEAF